MAEIYVTFAITHSQIPHARGESCVQNFLETTFYASHVKIMDEWMEIDRKKQENR